MKRVVKRCVVRKVGGEGVVKRVVRRCGEEGR